MRWVHNLCCIASVFDNQTAVCLHPSLVLLLPQLTPPCGRTGQMHSIPSSHVLLMSCQAARSAAKPYGQASTCELRNCADLLPRGAFSWQRLAWLSPPATAIAGLLCRRQYVTHILTPYSQRSTTAVLAACSSRAVAQTATCQTHTQLFTTLFKANHSCPCCTLSMPAGC